jgi:hypothetical protein
VPAENDALTPQTALRPFASSDSADTRSGLERYILDENHNAVEEPDLLKWAQWFETTKNRIVKQEHHGPYFVSTVFLGLDHSFALSGDPAQPPILFETMVFDDSNGRTEVDQQRCSTWDEAVVQHEAVASAYREPSELANVQSHVCGVKEAKEPKLPINTVNEILTNACRSIDEINARANQQVEQLGQRWEREIRLLQDENAKLRADLDKLIVLERGRS